MSESAVQGPAGGAGARLATARERAGLSLTQAADRLHLDVTVLQAIESERFDVFGAAVFARGHLRHYAELVGEAPAEIEALYAGRTDLPSMPDLTQTPSPTAPAAKFGFWPAAIVALVFVLAGFIWWALRVSPRHTVAPAPAASGALAPSQQSRSATAVKPA